MSEPFAKHFDGKRFYNPGAPKPKGFFDVLRWKLTSRPEPSPRFISDVKQSVPPHEVTGNELRITLINHSTMLIQKNGSNILTDPIWSPRASPSLRIGPQRRRVPGVRREDLPRIDIVLLSHNHYDHLDLPTLHWLASRGDPTTFIVPLGVARLLASGKIGPLHELDWGDSLSLGSTTIHAVPAVHFSARGISDRNKTLWCGYMFETQGRLVYYAGDTGFGNHFSQIRTQFGTPFVSLLPIGAYLPRWFMSPVHMDPAEALRAHEILGASHSIAIHHGTFQLADESLDAPKKELFSLNPPDSFLVLNNGQFVSFQTTG